MVRSSADVLLADEVAFHLKAIRELCVEYDVESLEVFGSAAVGTFDPAESDADFIVVFAEHHARLGFDHLEAFEDRLAEILDRPVDVLAWNAFRNPYFARSVNLSRRLLYGTAPAFPIVPEDIAVIDPAHDRTLKLLEDIRSTASALVDRSANRTFDDLMTNLEFRFFVERSFEIVGEAARRLRDEDPATFTRLSDGAKVVGTRNVIVHGYDEIKYDLIWEAIKGSVPQLLAEVDGLMSELSGGR